MNRMEDVLEKTDGMALRHENRKELSALFDSPDELKKLKEMGPEAIVENYGLVYII